MLSTVTGNVVDRVTKARPDIEAHVAASALAIIAGAIVCFIGLVRCGWIVDFISLAAISAFMTGSALNIAVGQVPSLMGIDGFSNRDATYKVAINILKHLGRTKIDAAMGLTALLLLYAIRSACNLGARKVPSRAKTFFFLATLRTAFVILLYTMISWLANRHHRKKPIFKILGTVPRGKTTLIPLSVPDNRSHTRIQERRGTQNRHQYNQLLCKRASCSRHRASYRTYCYCQIFRTRQQLYH